MTPKADLVAMKPAMKLVKLSLYGNGGTEAAEKIGVKSNRILAQKRQYCCTLD